MLTKPEDNRTRFNVPSVVAQRFDSGRRGFGDRNTRLSLLGQMRSDSTYTQTYSATLTSSFDCRQPPCLRYDAWHCNCRYDAVVQLCSCHIYPQPVGTHPRCFECTGEWVSCDQGGCSPHGSACDDLKTAASHPRSCMHLTDHGHPCSMSRVVDSYVTFTAMFCAIAPRHPRHPAS
jgi:hypothetical protein